ncbi:MAG: hypothetical protein K1X68_00985 [Saprospiraceae bacterium]|nr:hypothetical protein [Saprospiraceae bacterium]HMW38483.1 hypothetical protein [Saprospiraceae bacterium]HMX88382.1 hypothetical protein [Saprospiraceae bacterium]HMZ40274.1 hypothetical protein [Saprospiraceae bacterium]HNB29793.1 hypothetical protein [Saprospiraceae bacterium]
MLKDQKISAELLFSFLFTLLCVFLVFFRAGTGDDGDSILHYLYARYAFLHPENFFNHWAKPVYVILMAPVAIFGFTAVKLMNALMGGAALYFTMRSARMLGVNPPLLPGMLWAGIPMVYSVCLSGLTEPLFALILSLVIYMLLKQMPISAVILASFLPFVRSEGLILLPALAVCLLSIGQWKRIYLLLTGHVVMGLAGSLVYGSVFWVFTRIPYAGARNESYGHGDWDYYFNELIPAMGFFAYGCLLTGIFYGFYRLLAHWTKKQMMHPVELWAVGGMFASFFLAHIIFWRYGLFNSFGLIRVFMAVLPLMVLIAARPLADWYRQAELLSAGWLVWIPISIGLLGGLYYHQDWNYRLRLTEEQQAYHDLAVRYGARLSSHCVYTDAVYPLLELDKDYFNPLQTKRTPALYNGDSVPTHSSVIWDHRFSVVEAHIELDKVRNDKRFHLVDIFYSSGKPALYLFSTDTFASPYRRFKTILPPVDTGSADSIPESFNLGSQQEFFGVIEEMSASLPETNMFRVRLQYRLSGPPQACPKLVWSYEEPRGRVLEWTSIPIAESGTLPGQWNEFVANVPFHKEKFRGSKFKLYLWNNEKSSTELKNFSIEY